MNAASFSWIYFLKHVLCISIHLIVLKVGLCLPSFKLLACLHLEISFWGCLIALNLHCIFLGDTIKLYMCIMTIDVTTFQPPPHTPWVLQCHLCCGLNYFLFYCWVIWAKAFRKLSTIGASPNVLSHAVCFYRMLMYYINKIPWSNNIWKMWSWAKWNRLPYSRTRQHRDSLGEGKKETKVFQPQPVVGLMFHWKYFGKNVLLWFLHSLC